MAAATHSDSHARAVAVAACSPTSTSSPARSPPRGEVDLGSTSSRRPRAPSSGGRTAILDGRAARMRVGRHDRAEQIMITPPAAPCDGPASSAGAAGDLHNSARRRSDRGAFASRTRKGTRPTSPPAPAQIQNQRSRTRRVRRRSATALRYSTRSPRASVKRPRQGLVLDEALAKALAVSNTARRPVWMR